MRQLVDSMELGFFIMERATLFSSGCEISHTRSSDSLVSDGSCTQNTLSRTFFSRAQLVRLSSSLMSHLAWPRACWKSCNIWWGLAQAISACGKVVSSPHHKSTHLAMPRCTRDLLGCKNNGWNEDATRGSSSAGGRGAQPEIWAERLKSRLSKQSTGSEESSRWCNYG